MNQSLEQELFHALGTCAGVLAAFAIVCLIEKIRLGINNREWRKDMKKRERNS